MLIVLSRTTAEGRLVPDDKLVIESNSICSLDVIELGPLYAKCTQISLANGQTRWVKETIEELFDLINNPSSVLNPLPRNTRDN